MRSICFFYLFLIKKFIKKGKKILHKPIKAVYLQRYLKFILNFLTIFKRKSHFQIKRIIYSSQFFFKPCVRVRTLNF
ncbi:MAG: hypothetical protein RL757_223 [Bacteroidota bacterium]|jgi:hypothetical protein